ncbi:MAG: aspartate aminotransferase [Candidatus Nephthysia bennettiae]|uniref:Aminotransferase n=1 Tax=Candidatus Nephthysia bennettiae TaxID=3127016 RepID=A0A934K6Y7_9BACT|nr:pyridoxal phosphate-dependent aminotransferase [Candidatus Dormibacteraeota bacterium]MBJ7614078.1 pyridoxal phosphate-dependent aminotransferase [Candidatus Dormibacteraeota bacterium]PZR90083.1 MAG: aspartate aminotransferase [Candidatus Dormibacteraeota bacterium]
MALDARAKQLAAEGVDIVNLSVGEPDFDTPAAARAGGISAIQSGFTRYTAVAGTRELRRAISAKLLQENLLDYSPDQIVVSNGAKQSIYNALLVLLDPGDEVLIPAPYWVSYPEMVKLAGGVPITVPTDETAGFKVTAAAVATHLGPRARGIIINNPSNPTGAVYAREELESLAQLAVAHGIFILSDEIYERLTYDGARAESVASLGPDVRRLTITVNGFSKAYAMTGWRMGYAAAESHLAQAMGDLQSQTTSGPSSITQEAARAALEADQSPVEAMRKEFDGRRRYVLERLAAIPGMEMTAVPTGAFYVFPNVSKHFGRTLGGRVVRDAADLAAVVLETAGVAVVPGTPFGSPEHLRLSYAVSTEKLKEAMDRLERFFSQASASTGPAASAPERSRRDEPGG